jgi:hypothetical protein
MKIWAIVVLLSAPWAFGLVTSLGGFINYLLVMAIIGLAAKLIALVTGTVQRARWIGR